MIKAKCDIETGDGQKRHMSITGKIMSRDESLFANLSDDETIEMVRALGRGESVSAKPKSDSETQQAKPKLPIDVCCGQGWTAHYRGGKCYRIDWVNPDKPSVLLKDGRVCKVLREDETKSADEDIDFDSLPSVVISEYYNKAIQERKNFERRQEELKSKRRKRKRK